MQHFDTHQNRRKEEEQQLSSTLHQPLACSVACSFLSSWCVWTIHSAWKSPWRELVQVSMLKESADRFAIVQFVVEKSNNSSSLFKHMKIWSPSAPLLNRPPPPPPRHPHLPDPLRIPTALPPTPPLLSGVSFPTGSTSSKTIRH